jgi:hypothetical protein
MFARVANLPVPEAHMQRVRKATLAVTVLALCATVGCRPPRPPAPAGSADQQQLSIDTAAGGSVIGGNSEQIIAQVVTAGRSGQLTGVRLPVACASGNLIVEIRGVDAASGEPKGVALTAQTVSGPTIPAFAPAFPTLRTVSFAVPITMASGTRFAIVLSSAGQCVIFPAPAGDPYAGGNGWFDARPNPPHQWRRLNIGGGRDDVPFETLVTP